MLCVLVVCSAPFVDSRLVPDPTRPTLPCTFHSVRISLPSFIIPGHPPHVLAVISEIHGRSECGKIPAPRSPRRREAKGHNATGTKFDAHPSREHSYAEPVECCFLTQRFLDSRRSILKCPIQGRADIVLSPVTI